MGDKSNFYCSCCIIVSEYEAALVNANRPREDDDIGDDTDSAPSSMSSDITGSNTMFPSSDCNSTEQTFSIPSECSTTSSLPSSLPYRVTTKSKSLGSDIENCSSSTTDCSKDLQEKCFSSNDLNNGGATAAERPELFRFKSWSPSGELDPGKDGRNLNRSISHDPKSKKNNDGKKSLGKRFVNMFSKRKRHKKSSEHSTNEGNPPERVSSGESSLETTVTSYTTMDYYSEDAQKPCENLSPLKVTEARKLSLTDSLSSGESVSSPISPGYESGYMSSEGMYFIETGSPYETFASHKKGYLFFLELF